MKDEKVIIQELKEMFGDNVITSEETLREQSADQIGFRRWERYNGSYFAELPVCVIKPQNTEEVSKAVKYCYENKILIVPQSGRSCVCSGTETYTGSVIIDGSDMNKIVSFDEDNFMVTALCGTPLEYLEKYCIDRGYTTGHYPQSLPLAQMGGLVSTRSTGQLSTLYGGIEEMVMGLEAVLSDGTIIRIKNVPRRASGPDLRELFMGSEGNFGYVTEVTMKMYKKHPKEWRRAYGVMEFDTGLKAIKELMQDGWKPAVVRLHDAVEAELSYGSFMNEDENLLLFVAEGPEGIVNATAEAVDRIMKSHGCRDMGDKPVDVWFQIRNDTCDDLYASNKKGLLRDTCEVSGNWTDVSDIYKNVLKRFPEEIENVVQISAHSSHSYTTGTNLYFVFSFIGEKDLVKARSQYDTGMRIIMEETLRYGGSICHHHGVGKYRTKWMPEEHGSSYVMMKTLKKAFDPHNIMNTGTFLPREE